MTDAADQTPDQTPDQTAEDDAPVEDDLAPRVGAERVGPGNAPGVEGCCQAAEHDGGEHQERDERQRIAKQAPHRTQACDISQWNTS